MLPIAIAKASVEKLLITKAKKKPSTRKVIHEQLSISLSRGKILEILLTLQVISVPIPSQSYFNGGYENEKNHYAFCT